MHTLPVQGVPIDFALSHPQLCRDTPEDSHYQSNFHFMALYIVLYACSLVEIYYNHNE